jgi:hypothetical protein
MERRTEYRTQPHSLLPDPPPIPHHQTDLNYRTQLHRLIRLALRQATTPQRLYLRDPFLARTALLAVPGNGSLNPDQADAVILAYFNRTWPQLLKSMTPTAIRKMRDTDPRRIDAACALHDRQAGQADAYAAPDPADPPQELLDFWDTATEASLL